jgi:manganese/iron transport system substrate-binding protein
MMIGLARRAALAGGVAVVFAVIASAGSLAQGKLRVVTTFTVIQDIAQNVAGDAAIVESITEPGAEIHNYQPTPRDVIKAQSAQLVLWNGLNLEQWFERFYGDLPDIPRVVVSDGLEPVSITEGPYSGKPNPHGWMSTSSALIYIENIREALAKADPANAETYKRNAAAYAEKVKAIDAPLRARLSQVPEDQRWLVTSEGAFSYLARDYGWKEAYLWPINSDEQGTPQQVRRLIDLVRANQVPVVFSESTVSDKPARQVAAETGAAYGGVLYVDSLSTADGPVPNYLKLLQVTVETIVKGFGK